MSIYEAQDYRAYIVSWLAARPRWSQSWLPSRLGMSPTFISMMLKGDRDLRLHQAEG